MPKRKPLPQNSEMTQHLHDKLGTTFREEDGSGHVITAIALNEYSNGDYELRWRTQMLPLDWKLPVPGKVGDFGAEF